jgi:ethanolamine utilization protein EutN
MQLYKVIGKVTLSRAHPSFRSASLKATVPYGDELLARTLAEPDLVVVWDEFGAAEGSIIAVSDGAEAAQAFKPELKPVDAYNAAIIDEINLH